MSESDLEFIALQDWFTLAYELSFNQLVGVSDEQTNLFEFGKKIFSLPSYVSDWSSLSSEIDIIYSISLQNHEINKVLELFLIHAVSEHCPERTLFLQQIMEMDTETQMNLMRIIQNSSFLETESAEISKSKKDTSCYNNENNNVVNISHNTICKLCIEKESFIQCLRQEMVSNEERSKDVEKQLKESLAIETNKIVDVELTLIDRDEVIRHQSISIIELERKVKDYESQLKTKEYNKEKLVELQDQIDILKPQAERLSQAENQIEKLRSKIEELNEVKQHLKIEVASHSETYSSLVNLEQEVEPLRLCKTQLEEYRHQFTEASITIDDLRLQLSLRENEVDSLRKDNERLLGGQKEQFLQSQNLAEELKITAEQLREVERVGGIGEGLNEFNTALMQELERLKIENKTMTDKLDKSAIDKLSALEKEINDQKAINSSLQVKWTNTKDSLATANNNISSLKVTIGYKDIEISELQKRLVEHCNMSQQEISMIRNEWIHLMDAETIKYENELSLQKETFKQSLDELSVKLNENENSLETANKDIEALSEEKQTNCEKINELEIHCQELSTELTQERQQHSEIITNTQYQNAIEVENLKNSSKDEIIQLEEKFSKVLEEEKSRYLILKSDLEEETIKRRKVERVKKFYEAEVQRHKTQLQVANSSAEGMSNKDLDSVIKELKAMQQELDEARQEISFLKSNNNNSGKFSSNNESMLEFAVPVPEQSSRRQSISGKSAGRILRSKESEEYSDGFTSTFQFSGGGNGVNNSVPFGNHPNGQYGLTGYLEQAELSDKRIDVLTREKREMISKTLEENKEKMELSQKLLLSEKEISNLKSELRKITLDKERAERKLLKSLDNASILNYDKENIANHNF